MANPNPYTAPSTQPLPPQKVGATPNRHGLFRLMIQGAFVAVLGSFPVAALISLVFRFPVPFAGYQNGPGAMIPAMVGAVFYGLLGGVVVQAILGSISGIVVYMIGSSETRKSHLLSIACGLASALPGLLLLAILDWIIGPW